MAQSLPKKQQAVAADGKCPGSSRRHARRSIMADALINTLGEGTCVAKSAGGKAAGSEAEINTTFVEVFTCSRTA